MSDKPAVGRVVHRCMDDPEVNPKPAPPPRPRPVPEPRVRATESEVTCPACAHHFRAIPMQVQRLLLGAGFHPPFADDPSRVPKNHWTPARQAFLERLEGPGPHYHMRGEGHVRGDAFYYGWADWVRDENGRPLYGNPCFTLTQLGREQLDSWRTGGATP